MKDISNSTLALVIVLAIAVSAFGTYISLDKIDRFGYIGLSGFATTGSGKANLTVSATADITVNDGLIELGTLALQASNDSDTVNDYWEVENTGGVNVSIQIHSAVQGTSTLNGDEDGWGPFDSESSGGCVDLYGADSHGCFMIQCNSSGSGDCTTAWAQLPTSPSTVFLDDLYYPSEDKATFGVNVTIPPDESGGKKSQDITFTASNSQ